ncbi:HPr kinase/phosphorylase [Qipengyuania flava]|uniref:HPr kinase/phosphorylase n=1 Tax=Qipengyuania flava TaxID=192812 RepID=UPI001C5818A4|nr:serine kinase [Qipengyuania flava]MBW3167699.1 serine kinase [Qipengyuania flava]MBY5964937.1 serine kinase [Qipengyuania flava]MBY6011261.1 serine kinase [Qipengyuania flava]MBY6025703.1 serine kinase [Qipengyuania flava]
MSETVLVNVTGVAIGGRVLLIEGPPGAGKSSLALALIDRGATLVGDDAVTLDRRGEAVHALPPPNTAGLVEIRNVGIVEMPTTHGPVALILTLDPAAARFPLAIAERTLAGIAVPALPFVPGDAVQALRAEAALQRHGLPLPKAGEKA